MPVITLRDLSAPGAGMYYHLTDAQLRSRQEPEKGVFIAEGPKVVQAALKAGCEPLSLLMRRKFIDGLGAEIISRCGDIPVYTAEDEALSALTGFRLQRAWVLCAMRRPKEKTPEEAVRFARRVAVLEGINEPSNVGAIFRSAAALGMDAVLLTPACSDPLYRRSARVSMGTVFQIPWTHIGEKVSDWPHPGLDRLRALGFKTAAMALEDDSVSIDDPALLAEEKLAVILGTEGDGLAAKTIADCDYTVKIPMSHGVDSLNVAAASAVAFYQLSR